MRKTYSIILAAGKGTRMDSDLPKVVHQVGGRPMVAHVLDAVEGAGIGSNIVVVGHLADTVKDVVSHEVQYALQGEQKGTGHAVLMAEDLIDNMEAEVVVLCGDAPLITAETISKLIAYHSQSHADVTVLTALVDTPFGYGRIIRDGDGHLDRIVEEKDATELEKKVTEINTGTYVFYAKKLFAALHHVGRDNAQGEYYLTDVLGIIKRDGGKIRAMSVQNASEVLGVNTKEQLLAVEKIFLDRKKEKV